MGEDHPGAEYCKKSRSERVTFVSKQLTVKHPVFKLALEAAEYHYALNANPEELDEPANLVIFGDAGCGKTRLRNTLLDHHPETFDGQKFSTPLLVIELPEPATVMSVAQEFLHVLGSPLIYKGTIATLTRTVRSLLAEAGTRVIVIDEFHNLIDSSTSSVLRHASEWLKSLSNKTHVGMICLGRPEGKVVYRFNTQIMQRWTARNLDRFHWKDEGLREDYLNFLAGVDSQLPIADWSNLDDPDLAARLYAASAGIPRYLMRLITEGTRVAMEVDARRLDRGLLAEAYRRRQDDEFGPASNNPFEPEDFNVALAVKADEDIIDDLARSRIR